MLVASNDPVLKFLRSQKVLLASRSARRQELFQSLGLVPELVSGSIPEIPLASETPRQFALRIAREKVEAALNLSGREYFAIGADTIICLDGRIIGKPANRADARSILRELCNRSHQVLTAVHVEHNDRPAFAFATQTEVSFHSYSEVAIEDYLDSDLPFDRAGAYGIQDYFGSFFIRSIQGDYNNVLGFPLHDFYDLTLRYIAESNI
jgi:septum formation protein